MTQPPIVPAPPPNTAGPGAPPAARPKPAKAPPRPPIVARPAKPIRPGPLAAAAGGGLAASTAAGAFAAGPVGAVLVPAGLAVAGVGAVVTHRRMQRDPSKVSPRRAGRAAAKSTAGAAGGRQSLRDRLAGRRAQAPAAAPGAPRPGRAGGFPALGRRTPPGGGPGRPGGGLFRRGPAAAHGSPAGGRAGSRPAGTAGPGGGAVSPRRSRNPFRRNTPPSPGQPSRTPAGGPNRPKPGSSSPATRPGLGSRLWDRRPGRASRHAYAAQVNRNPRNPARTPATPTRPSSGRGVRAMLGRNRGGTPPTKAAPPPATAGARPTARRPAKVPRPGAANPAATKTPATTTPPAAPNRTVWSHKPKHQQGNLPPIPAQALLKTGQPPRLWNRWGRKSGSTKHTPWQPPPSTGGGGVGPVPGPKPAPAGPTGRTPAKPRPAATAPPQAAPPARPPAHPARPAPDPDREPAYGRHARPDSHDNWHVGDVEPLTEDARTAARDRWQRRTDKQEQTMTRPAHGSDSSSTGPARGGGSGEIQSMADDMPAFAARHQTEVEDLATQARRRAAEIRDGTPSSDAVADAWDHHAAVLAAAASTAAELHGLSQTVDADGYAAAERYRGRPGADTWMR